MDFEFRPGSLGTDGKTTYDRVNFSLEYTPAKPSVPAPRSLSESIDERLGIAAGPILVISYTLTLAFGTHERKLIALDAYENGSLWQQVPRAKIPEVGGTGSLVATALPPDADHESLGTVPVYEVNRDDAWIRIRFDGGSADAYYEVGHGLIAGLSGRKLTDIYLLDVNFLG